MEQFESFTCLTGCFHVLFFMLSVSDQTEVTISHGLYP
jgi:hypothetical protein